MYPARAIAAHAHQFRYASLKSNVEIAFVASLMITFIAVHSDMPERKDSIPLQLFDHGKACAPVSCLSDTQTLFIPTMFYADNSFT